MRRKWIGIIIILLICGGIYLGLTTGSNSKLDSKVDPPQSQQQQKEVPEKKVSNALLKVYSLDQTTRLKLKAKEMVQADNQNKLQLKEVRVEVYKGQEETEELEATLTADSGIYLPDSGKLKFFGPLRLTGKGVTVKADVLNWNQTKNHWQGKGNVVIIHKPKEVKLAGDKFVSHVDLGRLEVKGNVKLKSLN